MNEVQAKPIKLTTGIFNCYIKKERCRTKDLVVLAFDDFGLTNNILARTSLADFGSSEV